MAKKLIPGAYKSPHDRAAAQKHFFEAIRRLAPGVLDDLHHEVLPIFRQESGRLTLCPGERFVLAEAIWPWAEKHHLLGFEDIPRKNSLSRRDTPEYREVAKLLAPPTDSPREVFFYSWVLFAAYGTVRNWARLTRKPKQLDWTLPCTDVDLNLLRDIDPTEWESELARIFSPPPANVRKYYFASLSRASVETDAECIKRVLEDVKQ